jgi:hypothetical protein
MTNPMYLNEMTKVSAQKTSESTPRMLAGVGATLWWPVKAC